MSMTPEEAAAIAVALASLEPAAGERGSSTNADAYAKWREAARREALQIDVDAL